MSTDFEFCRMKRSVDGWWRWLHNSVNALNADELHFEKVKMVNCKMC